MAEFAAADGTADPAVDGAAGAAANGLGGGRLLLRAGSNSARAGGG
ncbi:hypothetical protein [Streptomyces sp. NPDC048057]